MLIQYINCLPQIPEYLIDDLDTILSREKTYLGYGTYNKAWSEEGRPDAQPALGAWPVSDELRAWVKENVPFKHIEHETSYGMIWPALPIHKDYPDYVEATLLPIGLNYVVKNGGPDVVTSIYEDDGTTCVQSMKIEERRWLKFPAHRMHGVDGIVDSPRILVRVHVLDPDVRWEDIV